MTKRKVIELLDAQHVDWRHWGSNGSKSIDALVGELAEEEMYLTFLSDDTLALLILGVGVLVTYESLVLRECQQLFPDGTVLTKDYENSVGEKQKQGESPELAAYRALSEELGIGPEHHQLLGMRCIDYRTRGPINAGSYPGLLAIYRYHVYQVTLPPSLYREGGYREVQNGRTTHFVWVPAVSS